jgi:WXG100 family type VII secretion target
VAHFSVSTPALGYSAASMAAALADFDARVAQVSASVNSVVGASWTGDASDEFAAAWADWLAGAATTRAALADIVARLQGAEAGYASTEAGLTAASRSSRVDARRTEGRA